MSTVLVHASIHSPPHLIRLVSFSTEIWSTFPLEITSLFFRIWLLSLDHICYGTFSLSMKWVCVPNSIVLSRSSSFDRTSFAVEKKLCPKHTAGIDRKATETILISSKWNFTPSLSGIWTKEHHNWQCIWFQRWTWIEGNCRYVKLWESSSRNEI